MYILVRGFRSACDLRGWASCPQLHTTVVRTRSAQFAPSKGIQDGLEFWNFIPWLQIPGTGFQSFSVKLEFRIPIVNEILDPLSSISDSKAQDAILAPAKISRIPVHGAAQCEPRSMDSHGSYNVACE